MMEASPAESDATVSIEKARVPKHVAIIMDGNGRWAKERGWHRSLGHASGVTRVREIVKEADRLGIKVLTLYCFSTENWNRPSDEIEVLMELLKEYLISERSELNQNNVRLQTLGQKEKLSLPLQDLLNETEAMLSKNTGLVLNLCFSYGARAEIVMAVQNIARKVKAGEMDIAEISDKTISENLYTQGLPDPDLIIRTSGEFRISNFLLWQSAYSEYFITDTLWPDFEPQHLRGALESFKNRKRRFGRSDEPAPLEKL